MKRIYAMTGAALLGACAHIPAGMPPPAPRTIAFLDGEEFALTQPMTFTIAPGRSVTVPTGFVTDYASVPRELRWLVGPQGRYSRATILHDYLYWVQVCSRKQSDNLLWIVMAQSGAPADKRVLIIDGVRLGGASVWANNQRERRDGLVRVVPAGHLGLDGGKALADAMTWKDARNLLKTEHAGDPAPSFDPAICALGDQRRVP